MDFKLDKRKLMKLVEPAMHATAAEIDRDYAEMSTRLKNKPLDEVKSELISYHRGRGGSITDPELTRIAEAFRAGETVRVEFGDATR